MNLYEIIPANEEESIILADIKECYEREDALAPSDISEITGDLLADIGDDDNAGNYQYSRANLFDFCQKYQIPIDTTYCDRNYPGWYNDDTYQF